LSSKALEKGDNSSTVSDIWSHVAGAPHPAPQLLSLAKSHGLQVTDLELARLLDKANPVQHLRNEFNYPSLKDIGVEDEDPDTKCNYLCGHGLRLQPKETRILINQELDKWAAKGIFGHYTMKRPWVTIDHIVKEEMVKVVGAEPIEVSAMIAASVNLHVGMAAFYRPTSERYKILMESKAFPTDHYAAQSQLQLHGFNPEIRLLTVEPQEGEHML
jgi:kynureninase